MTTVRDIVVIGGSAGALNALQEIIRGLPRHLPASVFVGTRAGGKQSATASRFKRRLREPAVICIDQQVPPINGCTLAPTGSCRSL
jgi:hypothetical protein